MFDQDFLLCEVFERIKLIKIEVNTVHTSKHLQNFRRWSSVVFQQALNIGIYIHYIWRKIHLFLHPHINVFNIIIITIYICVKINKYFTCARVLVRYDLSKWNHIMHMICKIMFIFYKVINKFLKYKTQAKKLA